MKKLLALFSILALIFPVTAFAVTTQVPWQKTGSILEPLRTSNTDTVRVNVLQATSTTATSTFAAGASAVGFKTTNGLTITGGNILSTSNSTSTLANGFNVTTGCYAVNGTCISSSGGGVTSLAATFPLQTTGSSGAITISTAFGTTTTAGLGTNSLVSVNASGVLVASSTIGNAQLQYPSIIVTTASPLGGAATVPLGGTLALTCTGCLTANQSITLTGAVTGSGATAITTSFGNTAVANSVLANITGGSAAPAFIATSTLFQNASAANTGLLSSTDWTTFNGKQAAGNYITALTGDVTASGPGSVAATIALNVAHAWTALQIYTNSATSTWVGGLLSAAGVDSKYATHQTLNLGSGAASSTFVGGATTTTSGGFTSVGLASSNGLTITGGVSQLGTVQSGTWQGTTVAVGFGGTGVASFGGTNTILYTSSANTLSSITTGNSKIFVTDSGGIPSWGSTLPAFTLGGAVTGSSQAITGLSQLTVTGITASSTFTGGVQVGLTNGYFGIGTSTPWAQFSLQALPGNTGYLESISTTTNPTMGPARMMNNLGFSGYATITPVTTIDINNGVVYMEEGSTTPASTMNLDWRLKQSMQITMNANITTLNFTGVYPGMIYTLLLCQGNQGSYTVTNYDSRVLWNGGKPTLLTGVGKCDEQTFSAYNGTSTPIIVGSDAALP